MGLSGTLLGRDLFDWTGWIVGLAGLALSVLAELRFRAEHRRLRRVTAAVQPTVPAPGTGAAAAHRPAASLADDRLRSTLIQVAVDGRPLAVAVERARTFGATRDDVTSVARRLKAARLLRFDEPLTDDTKIRLT